jgi:hypothetical protein
MSWRNANKETKRERNSTRQERSTLRLDPHEPNAHRGAAAPAFSIWIDRTASRRRSLRSTALARVETTGAMLTDRPFGFCWNQQLQELPL